jgi:hypothetical protein
LAADLLLGYSKIVADRFFKPAKCDKASSMSRYEPVFCVRPDDLAEWKFSFDFEKALLFAR